MPDDADVCDIAALLDLGESAVRTLLRDTDGLKRTAAAAAEGLAAAGAAQIMPRAARTPRAIAACAGQLHIIKSRRTR